MGFILELSMNDEELPQSSSRISYLFHYLFRIISCEGWFVGIIALAAFLIRIYIAATGSYWVDEIVMIEVGRGSTQSVINFLITDTAQGPFSWLVIHALVRISEAEWFLRLFQVLAGSLAVYYAYFFMRDTMGRRAGLIAAVLMAISLNGINYSTDCRYYSYLVLFSLAMAHHYQATLSTGLKRHYILFGIATLLNIYNGHFAFFLGLIIVIHMMGTVIVRVIRPAGGITFNRYVLIAVSGLAALILYLPWLGVMLSFFNGPWGIAGGNFSSEATGGTTLDKLLITIGGRFGSGSFAHPESDWHSFIFPVLFLLMWVQGKRGLQNRIFILLWLVLPLYILLSVQARHYFTIRYFMIIFPALVLGAAGGLDRLWHWIIAIIRLLRPRFSPHQAIPLLKTATVGSALAVIALSAPYLSDVIQYPKQDWKRSVEYVKSHAKPDDVIFLNSGDVIGTFYYLKPQEYRLRVETRDDTLPWACAGNADVWLVMHYFENNSLLFQQWVNNNLELVKIMPGTMIPIYIYRFHHPDTVARNNHLVWYPILAPPEIIKDAKSDITAQMALVPVTFPQDVSFILGWIYDLTGSYLARVHSVSPPDKECSLEVFDGEGKEILQQQQFMQDELTPSVLWQKRKRLNIAIQLKTGVQPLSVKSTEITQAQCFPAVEGITLFSGKRYVSTHLPHRGRSMADIAKC